MPLPDENRYCPSCGTRTDAEFCPADGVPTLVRKKLDVDATAVREGDVIDGRYRVTGVLGRGGFGAVYSAEHTGTQQKVALKMMLTSNDGVDEHEIRRFYREAQVTASLRHQNTVRVFDVGQTKAGALYIAMELLNGPTLEAVLRERWKEGMVLTESEALRIVIPALKSLAEAHSNKLVHRDLKPANIMLAEMGDDEPTVKVLDFGIARAQDSSLTGAGTALGTPAYMSPEQCQGGELDARSDLYSLGIILYRCVCGTPPYNDRNPLTVMFHHTTSPASDLREVAKTPVSEGLAECVRKVLAKKRDERFSTAREMRLALEAVAAGEPLSKVMAAVAAPTTSSYLSAKPSSVVRVATGQERAIAAADVDSDTMMSLTPSEGAAGLEPAPTGNTSKRTQVVSVDPGAGENDATGAVDTLPMGPPPGPSGAPPGAVAPAPPAVAAHAVPAAAVDGVPTIGTGPQIRADRGRVWMAAAAIAVAVGVAAALLAGGGPAEPPPLTGTASGAAGPGTSTPPAPTAPAPTAPTAPTPAVATAPAPPAPTAPTPAVVPAAAPAVAPMPALPAAAALEAPPEKAAAKLDRKPRGERKEPAARKPTPAKAANDAPFIPD